MTVDIAIPSLGESVTEARLLRWRKGEGERVEADEAICELETDKANVDLPAPAAGRLHRMKAEGDAVKIGDVVAQVEEGGAAVTIEKSSKKSKVSPPAQSAPTSSPADTRPSVRRLVAENAVSPSQISGSGPHGQLTKEDVVSFLEEKVSLKSPAKSAPISAFSYRR